MATDPTGELARTEGLVDPDALGLPPALAAAANRYEPSPPGRLAGLVAGLDLSAWGLLDLGCGRGRVLAEAARLPFREVVGVEASPWLADEARALMAGLPAPEVVAGGWRVHTEDAATFLPGPGAWVVYAFNPFSASVLARALAGLLAARGPDDRMRLLYRFPQHASVPDRDARWRPCGEVDGVGVWEAEPWG